MSNAEIPSFVEFVQIVIDALDAADVDYLIGGAVALAIWGDPRMTRDLDLVVDLPLESVGDLSKEFEKRGMLVPVEVLIDLMIEDRADLPVNAIHMPSGYKAELFLLKPGDAFRENNLKRRRLVDFGPPLGQAYVHTPEDLILHKLRYYTISQQPKHIRDIASIILSMGEELDYGYIDQWATRLDLMAIWRKVQQQIKA